MTYDHSTTQSTKADIHKEVTDQIISLLDQVNLDDYQPPFAALAAQGLPENPITTNRYQGVNILTLWFNQQARNFTSNEWATFQQWKEKGAQVRKGEKGTRIVFYKTLIKPEQKADGATEDKKIPMLKMYTVFNSNQVDGYGQPRIEIPTVDNVKRIDLVDAFCTGTKADIRHGEGRAFYNSAEDFINMPPTNHFLDTCQANATENYYATLLHELTHWTGAKHRLDRDKAKTKIELDKYAFEELVAELGAAFLCAEFKITQTLPEHHAIYIKSWLDALKNDKTLIFKASAQAARAVEYLNTLTKEI